MVKHVRNCAWLFSDRPKNHHGKRLIWKHGAWETVDFVATPSESGLCLPQLFCFGIMFFKIVFCVNLPTGPSFYDDLSRGKPLSSDGDEVW
jgi:hypothetical protein